MASLQLAVKPVSTVFQSVHCGVWIPQHRPPLNIHHERCVVEKLCLKSRSWVFDPVWSELWFVTQISYSSSVLVTLYFYIS